MTEPGVAFIGLSALTAVFVAVLAFALLRFLAASRDARRRGQGTETALLSSALQDAVVALKRQEQAMSARASASEALNTLIVERLTAGLLLIDRAGGVELLNPAGRRMLGVAAVPAGSDYHMLLAHVPPLVEALGTGLRHDQPIVRRSLRLPSGLPVTHLGLTISGLGGEAPRGVICLFSDLTAVVELEEQLRLRDALARVGELTAGIAHEFRNGLATIHGYARLLDPERLPDDYTPYIRGIRDETDALSHIVTNFLRFARPQSIALAPVDLVAVARKAALDLQHELPEGTVVSVAPDLGTIDGDDGLLRQVFGNLLRNAADACAAAGIVPAIGIARRPDDRRHHTLVIDDNGPGIAAEVADRIFQPFFTTRTRGTGLGLAIVQKFILLHNGDVAVGRSPAGGARIEVRFPIAES